MVVGILIALQINNWNEKNKLVKEKYKVLIELRNEFSKNQNELKIKIGQHKSVKEGIDKLTKLLNPNPREIETNNFDTLMFSMTYIPKFNALNAISTSEKFALVDDKLKNEVALWKLNYDDYKYKYSIKITYDFYWQQVHPFLSENYQLKNIKNPFYKSEKSSFDTEGLKILSNSIFENHVLTRRFNADLTVIKAVKLFELQNGIIENIDLELKNRK